MNNIKQAQANYDNQLPPDTTERDELIKDYAETLVEYGVIDHPEEPRSYIYLDELEAWMDGNRWMSILTQSKINQYKQLQLELCERMLSGLMKN